MATAATAFIGLMSGTAGDGIDACLARFTGGRARAIATLTQPWPESLHREVMAAMAERELTMTAAFEIDARLAEAYAEAVDTLLARAGWPHERVRAIGCHGQTVLHRPDQPPALSVQLGDPHRLAAATGIDVVADFRRADIALGGQGAPLAPAFHAYAFGRHAHQQVVVNIGGMANVTVIAAGGERVTGFDTGPGNALLDAWIGRHHGLRYDADGAWASTGRVDSALLERLFADPYFQRTPPKSTGREHFHLAWLDATLAEMDSKVAPADVQATLAELTAVTIADAVARHATRAPAVWICGGGARNPDLLARLRARQPRHDIAPTDERGIDADYVEALAFAWLAQRRLQRRASNRPEVTGASAPTVLGSWIHAPRRG